MVEIEENRKLSKSDIQDLKKDGFDLDETGFYILKFLFNDKWNQAADPRPFRIKSELMKKLAKDSIGMPYVIDPDDNSRHVKADKKGLENTAENLLQIQAEYSIGEINAYIISPSNNAYGIIKVWPDYQADIESGKIPVFTSPTIFPLKEDAEGIEDAQFLNINAVSVPGYTRILSGTLGVCKNGIKQCMRELAPLAAAGNLKTSRADKEKFSNTISNISKSMSTESTTDTPPKEVSNAEVIKAVEAVQAEVKTVQDEVKVVIEKEEQIITAEETNAEVLKEVATVTDGVDETKVVTKIEEAKPPAESKTPVPPADEAPLAAAGKTKDPAVLLLQKQNKELSSKLQALEDENKSKAQKEADQLRTAQATSIVDRQIILKQVKKDDRKSEIKKLFELKNEDGTSQDLTSLDNYLKSVIAENPDNGEPEIVGASGFVPELTGDNEAVVSMTNDEANQIMRSDN